MSIADKIKEVMKGFVTIKNQVSEKMDVHINMLTINHGNTNFDIKLQEGVDVAKLRCLTPDLERLIEEKVRKMITPKEQEILQLPEKDQYLEIANAASLATSSTITIHEHVNITEACDVVISIDGKAEGENS